MLSTEDRNKLAISMKADAINRRHKGKIQIKEDPAEYAGSIVTIPSLAKCAALSFTRELIDDTPGKVVRVVSRELFGGGVRGFTDIDDQLQGKELKPDKQQVSVKNKKALKKLDKALNDSDEQALDDFFASLL